MNILRNVARIMDEGIVWQVIILNIFRPNSNFHCPQFN